MFLLSSPLDFNPSNQPAHRQRNSETTVEALRYRAPACVGKIGNPRQRAPVSAVWWGTLAKVETLTTVVTSDGGGRNGEVPIKLTSCQWWKEIEHSINTTKHIHVNHHTNVSLPQSHSTSTSCVSSLLYCGTNLVYCLATLAVNPLQKASLAHGSGWNNQWYHRYVHWILSSTMVVFIRTYHFLVHSKFGSLSGKLCRKCSWGARS
jgi:hypothetical protein